MSHHKRALKFYKELIILEGFQEPGSQKVQ